MSQEQLNPELSAFEAALSAIRPKPTGMDRDRLMYEAGRAAALAEVNAKLPSSGLARRTAANWLWPLATASSLLLAAAVTLWPVLPLHRQPALTAGGEKGSELFNRPAVNSSDPFYASVSYMRLRELVLTRGVEAIPSGGDPARKSPGGPRALTPGDVRSLLDG